MLTLRLACWGVDTRIEVRDSRTGYLLPARDGPRALPDGESCWDAVAVAAAVAVSRKMLKYEEINIQI